MLSALVLCALAQAVPAQKKPKPALKEKDARRAIAAMPGFALNTGAVSVREISAAGTTPVTVAAEVTTAFRFEKAGEAKGQVELLAEKIAGATVAETKWRAVEVRTGDRNWEELDFLVAPLGAEKVVRARAALEALVAEFEAEQRRAGKEIIEPITRGGLRIKQLSPMGSSVVAEVGVEATFNLARDAAGKWRVVEAAIADASSGELASLVSSFNSQKAARALAEMETIKAALEAFRRERGFYVVAGDETVLMDHLSPRYIERIIRIDPWHRPYRYEGTGERFILSSDGPDGKAGTPDDVSPASINPTAGQRAVKGAR
jgi:hypothetical protein